MGIVALAGTTVGWVTYELLFLVNPLAVWRASTTWIIGFLIGVIRQHALHRYFTFTERGAYWRTLRRAYLYYLSCAVITTVLNGVLTERYHLHYRAAWAICTLFVALMSLFVLKRMVFLPAGSTDRVYTSSKNCGTETE